MATEYKWTRLDLLVKTEEVSGSPQRVVVTLICGLTAKSDDGYPAYMDTAVSTPLDPDHFIPYDDLTEPWAEAIANVVAEKEGWRDALDAQIAAARLRPVLTKSPWQEAEPSE